MRRRKFLAASPRAAATRAARTEKTQAPLATASPAPFQPAGEEIYERPDVHAGDRPVGASFASRSAVYGRSGAAATAHPLATQAGIEILKAGGSAVDAGIAINACLGFLEPIACGIGGDVYAMLWDPGQSKVIGLAGSGRSPLGLSLEVVRSRARNGALPQRHAGGWLRSRLLVAATVDGLWEH